MKITKLVLQNFRCYPYFEQIFAPGINIICGSNACGKTSLIEAIYILALTKSFKTKEVGLLISKGGQELGLKGWFEGENAKKEVIVLNSKNYKKIYVNQKQLSTASELIGEIPIVVFSPSDIELLTGGPSARRKFFESILCQLDQGYCRASIEYKKLLRERNDLLKVIKVKGLSEKYLALLEVLTDQLVDVAKVIINGRDHFIKMIASPLNHYQQIISNQKEQLIIKYNKSCPIEGLKTCFDQGLDDELVRGVTLWGPHRDDYKFSLNGLDVEGFGSQGQMKSCVISTKLASFTILKDHKGCVPIVLLDDVFSELDKSRQNQLLTIFDQDVQILITTTSLTDLEPHLIENAKIITLEERRKQDG